MRKPTANKLDTLTHIQPTIFSELAWWTKLDMSEQKEVVSAAQKLSDALVTNGYSKIAIGEHLTRLQSVLEPHNLFQRFLKNFHFSKRTAYRYIAGYNNAKARLPEPIIKAAMARGYNMIGDSELKPLGVYTEAVAKLPPPQNPNAEQAVTWLDQVEQVRKDNRSAQGTPSLTLPFVPSDPNTLMRECYKFVSLRYKRLPNNSRTRNSWVRSLVGMMLTELGSGQQTFAPIAIPQDYTVQRGRPREVVQQAAA